MVKSKALLLSFGAFLILVGPAMAVGNTTVIEKRQEIQQKREEIKTQVTQMKDDLKEKRDDFKDARCKLIESRINSRLNLAEQNRDKHYQIYEGVRKRIANLINQWKNRGCEVGTLQTKLDTFNTMIEEFAAAFREATTSLQTTREYRCGESQGKFSDAAKNSKTKMDAVKTKAQAVHEYFKASIQPELSQRLKACRPSPRPSSKPSGRPMVNLNK